MGLFSAFFGSSASRSETNSKGRDDVFQHGHVHGIAWDDLSDDEGGYTLVRSKVLSYAEVTAQNLPNIKNPILSMGLPAKSRRGCDEIPELAQCGAPHSAAPPHCQTQLDDDEGGASKMSGSGVLEQVDNQFLELETIYLSKEAHRKQRWRESILDGKTIKHRRDNMNEHRTNRFIIARHGRGKLV